MLHTCVQEARRCNVEGSLHAAEWALGRPHLLQQVPVARPWTALTESAGPS